MERGGSTRLQTIRRVEHTLVLRLVTQERQVWIMRHAHAQRRLQLNGTFKGLKRRLDGPEACTRRGQRVVRVRRVRLALESALEHLLRGDVIAAVKLNHAAVIERFGVARERALRAQTVLRDHEVGTRARRHLGHACVLLNELAEEDARLRETTARKLLVRALECLQGRGLVARRLTGRGRRGPRRLGRR